MSRQGHCWIALLVGIAPAVAFADSEHHPRPLPEARFEAPAPGTYELPVIDEVTPHLLLAPSGERVPLVDLVPGQVAFVSFVYLSCPGVCPRTTAVLQALDRELAGQPGLAGRVKLVTVSFDPARDTPEAMGHLEKQLLPRGSWRFLTAGSPEEIVPVLSDFGQDVTVLPDAQGEPSGLLHHVLKVFLVDAAGAVRNVYSAGFLDVRILRNDALTLLGR